MRRQLVRRASKAARFARGTGFFSLLLAVLATLLFRNNLLDALAFGVVMLLAAGIAVLAWVFGLAGLWKLWNEGAKAGTASLIGIVLAGVTLAPFAIAAVQSARVPALNDITTDLADPPVFPVGARVDVVAPFTPPPPADEAARMQAAAYPDLSPRLLDNTPSEAIAAVRRAAQTLGWTATTRGGSLEVPSGALLAFESRSLLFGFTDDIVVRLRPAGEQLVLDVRIAGRFGGSDLGAHAKAIRAFQQALDTALQARAP
jgi:uncharacterized protein (DUF1499 family)